MGTQRRATLNSVYFLPNPTPGSLQHPGRCPCTARALLRAHPNPCTSTAPANSQLGHRDSPSTEHSPEHLLLPSGQRQNQLSEKKENKKKKKKNSPMNSISPGHRHEPPGAFCCCSGTGQVATVPGAKPISSSLLGTKIWFP